ncbi:hypothetical protein CHARACLAT_011228 [Characodon lateralis]|uniref:Uncharacterized protein n=1 Tax=Characodon lateralis TaxID=208331 RepID=A0ABU7EJU8_9TELE|nr:hypothetical protein [Characodon lateralis]
MLPTVHKKCGDNDFFSRGLATCPLCHRYQSWFNNHDVTVLDWPAKWPDLKTNTVDKKVYPKEPSITPQQNDRPIVSMPRSIDAPAPSIKSIEMNILYRSLTPLFKIFFILFI